MRLRITAVFLCLLLCFSLVGCSTNNRLSDVSEPDENGLYHCFFDKLERTFTLYVPEGAGKNSPLVFMLHGYGGIPQGFASFIHMNEQADKYGFVVVYPQGLPSPTDATGASCWNSGIVKSTTDDTGFLVALAKYLQKTYGYSKEYTFAAGFSNGAFMTHRLACEAPKTFKAIASVAGTMSGGAWAVRKHLPVGILQISGTEDTLVPLTGTNLGSVYGEAPGIDGVIGYWVDTDKLEKHETIELSSVADIESYSSENSDKLVWYVEVQNGSHSWPQKKYSGFCATELIAEYFNRYVEK